jgi:hypothetical protein
MRPVDAMSARSMTQVARPERPARAPDSAPYGTLGTIVIPAYSRLFELDRLLRSVTRSLPGGREVRIVVVIDGGRDSIRPAFDRGRYEGLGGLEVIAHDAALGLRENVLFCGDLVETHGPCMVLEDDLIVGPDFLENAEALLRCARQLPDVAAASLYNFEYNEFASTPVLVRTSGLAKVQSASSWGQIWWPEKWAEFRRWLQTDYADDKSYNVPALVRRWPETSWKKLSFAFNSGARGAHNAGGRNVAYSTLEIGRPDYLDVPPDRTLPSFDAYLEPLLETLLPGRQIAGVDVADIECDLYGLKERSSLKREYVLTLGQARHALAEFDGDLGAPLAAALSGAPGKGLALVAAADFEAGRNAARLRNISRHHAGWLNNRDLLRLLLRRAGQELQRLFR